MQGLILYVGRTWTFCSFRKMKEMLSSLLLQKYFLKDARGSTEEADKEQSCAWTRRPAVTVTVPVCASEQACCLCICD